MERKSLRNSTVLGDVACFHVLEVVLQDTLAEPEKNIHTDTTGERPAATCAKPEGVAALEGVCEVLYE